jgi:hypothetical protein
MTEVNLDWGSAGVRDGTLELALRGELPTGWAASFDRTAGLLRGDEMTRGFRAFAGEPED